MSRRTLFILCVVLVIGFGVRVVHYLSVRDSAFLSLPEVFTQSDMHATLSWAQRIVEGNDLSAEVHLRRGNFESALAERDSLIWRTRDGGFRQLEERTRLKAASIRVLHAEELLDRGMTERVREILPMTEAVFGADVGHPETCYRLAGLYRATGDHERACAYGRRFLEIAPNDPRASKARELLEACR